MYRMEEPRKFTLINDIYLQLQLLFVKMVAKIIDNNGFTTRKQLLIHRVFGEILNFGIEILGFWSSSDCFSALVCQFAINVGGLRPQQDIFLFFYRSFSLLSKLANPFAIFCDPVVIFTLQDCWLGQTLITNKDKIQFVSFESLQKPFATGNSGISF